MDLHHLYVLLLFTLYTLRPLRSSDQSLLSMPREKQKTEGYQAFKVRASLLWNAKLHNIRQTSSLFSFKTICLLIIDFCLYSNFICAMYFISLDFIMRFKTLRNLHTKKSLGVMVQTPQEFSLLGYKLPFCLFSSTRI